MRLPNSTSFAWDSETCLSLRPVHRPHYALRPGLCLRRLPARHGWRSRSRSGGLLPECSRARCSPRRQRLASSLGFASALERKFLWLRILHHDCLPHRRLRQIIARSRRRRRSRTRAAPRWLGFAGGDFPKRTNYIETACQAIDPGFHQNDSTACARIAVTPRGVSTSDLDAQHALHPKH